MVLLPLDPSCLQYNSKKVTKWFGLHASSGMGQLRSDGAQSVNYLPHINAVHCSLPAICLGLAVQGKPANGWEIL